MRRKGVTDRKKPDPLDGAQYWKVGAKPEDYMISPVTGLRPDEKEAPYGKSTTTLEHTIKHVTLPTRSVWAEGHWLLDWKDYQTDADDLDDQDLDIRTWVVSGEGTPGNFIERHYVLPDELAVEITPQHPKDWKASVFKTYSYPTTSPSSQTQGGTKPAAKKPAVKAAPPLPVGIRFRDPNCGHWFRESDLAGHAKVCPGTQGGESDWAIACECCASLDDTAKCKKGFPRPKPKPSVAAEPAKPKSVVASATIVEPKKEVKKSGDGTPAT